MPRVTVNVPDEIGEAARTLADERGQSVSSFYAEAVEAHIERLRRERAVDTIERLIEEYPPPSPEALDELEQMRDESDRGFE